MVSVEEKRYTSGMSATINARERIPSHGVGRLVNWEPGQSGNPTGRPTGMKELRTACRKICGPGVKALERILTETVIDQDGNVRNAHDGKVIVAAMQIAMTWGFGKPPDYDPKEDEAGLRFDTTWLSPTQRRNLLDALRAGVIVPDDEAPPSEHIDLDSSAVVVADLQPIKDDT